MLGLRLNDASLEGRLRVLAIGAHADDIEIGCGATILELAAAKRLRSCCWVVLATDDTRADEARASAAAFLSGCDTPDVRVASFPESYLPYVGGEVKDYVESLAADLAPDLVLTHHRGDLHQDHRLVAELGEPERAA